MVFSSKKIKQKIPVLAMLALFLTVCLILGKLFFWQSKPLPVFGLSFLIVTSGSMQPDYPVNTLVVIKSTPFKELKTGDIIAYESKALGGKLAFHRIIRITEDGVYTKGDNNSHEDNQLITSSTYVGKGILKNYHLGRYIVAIHSPIGFLVFLALPALSIYVAIILLKRQFRK